MSTWPSQSVFYHLYPLGCGGAPWRNDFQAAPENRLEPLAQWLDHWEYLGVNALYLGPVFESSTHGYDTADYFRVDRRLGTNADLAGLVAALHRRGIRVVLDAVFNHVGRDFWAFQDVRARGRESRYCGWIFNLDFSRGNPCGDPFSYETWQGHWPLVKLNVLHPEVKDHLFAAVASWIREYDIDGLRLDAADCIAPDFLRDLAAFGRRLKPEFWVMGEVIHGDYRQWANPGCLDSVTNYEIYKGLYSSLNDRNLFEIAHSLDRQFGPRGIYRGLELYNFADNHDVTRLATILREPRHLYVAYCLLFCMPGIPSIYYGSEWGIPGRKLADSDRELRPRIDPGLFWGANPHPDLPAALHRLSWIRRRSAALMTGDYRNVAIAPEQLAFLRQAAGETVLVAANAAAEPATLALAHPELAAGRWEDLLNRGDHFEVPGGGPFSLPLPPGWARILRKAG